MRLNVPQFSTASFSHNAARKSLTAEASELGVGRGKILHSRIWNDSCDVGFELIGKKTTVWALDSVHSNPEGEITHWTYIPANSRDAATRGYVVTVFND